MLSPAEAWSLARRSVRGWSDDSASSMGAALAFYTLFSLAPILLLAVAVAGFFMGHDAAQDAMMANIARMAGDKTALGIEALVEAAGTRGASKWPAIVGTLTLILGATTVFAELKRDLDRIWHVTSPQSSGAGSFVRTRLLSFGLVMAIGFLLLLSLGVSAVLAAVGSSWLAGSEVLVHAGEFVTSFLVITGLFAMIYKLLPAPRIAWSDVWVGAAITSLLFWVGKLAIGLYIGKAAVGSGFGAAGTLVVVIVWVYYSAQVFFLGAEFTREYALTHGSKQGMHHIHERRRVRGTPVAANDDQIKLTVTSAP